MPEIPVLTSSIAAKSNKQSSNKRKAESSEELKSERAKVEERLKKARKELKPHGSFDST